MRRVGIDLAFTAPHRAVVYEDGEALGRPFGVERTKAGMEELFRRATAEHDGPCEFVMEPTGLAWLPVVAEVARRGHRAFVPKPQKTKALRQVYSPFAKADGVDARAAALVRHVDPQGVHELRVPSPGQSSLRLLVQQRARLTKETTKSKQRIHGWLRLANPHLSTALGGDAFTNASQGFLRRHVDPFSARKLGKSRLWTSWCRHSHGTPNAKRFEAVWEACTTTCELYDGMRADGALPFEYPVLQQMVTAELDRMQFLDGQIRGLEKLIRERLDEVDPSHVLESQVPGVGTWIAAAIEAYVGDVERFANVKSFASYFGIVPRTKHTGGKGKPGQRMTKGGPNLLKQYVYLAAEVARRKDPELAAVYDRAIAKGKHHRSAVIVVAHKLVRRIYALLKRRAALREAAAEADAQPAAVIYRLRRPDGQEVTRAEASAYIAEHHPPKSAKAKRSRAAEGGPPCTGSSVTDATKGVSTMPPDVEVPELTRHRKSGAGTEDDSSRLHNARGSQEADIG